MLSLTHIAIGLASTMTILGPQNAREMCPIVIGGTVGSILCDIDCKFGKSKDAVVGRIVAGIVSGVGVYIDLMNHGRIFNFIIKNNIISLVLGLLIILMTGYFSRESEHRGFSHSLLAFALYSAGIYLFCRPLLLPFVIGFASHLMLDLINCRPVHLLFPYKNGFSLKLCKANSKTNIVIMILGYVWLGLYLYLNL